MKLRQEKLKRLKLDDIFIEDDDLGLLQDLPTLKASNTPKEEQALVKFREIETFVRQQGREPQDNSSDPAERSLGNSLKAYRKRSDLRAKMMVHDALGLLETKGNVAPKAVITTIEDIFDNDDLGLLEDIDSSIFIPRTKSEIKEKELPDEIATRKPCKDFYRFEKFFADVQKAINDKAVIAKRFTTEADAHVGQVLVLRGLLCYVDSVMDAREHDERYNNPRLRVIFANGTETNILQRSLARALYKNAHSRLVDYSTNLFSPAPVDIDIKNNPSGFIYILATKSTAPVLAKLKAQGMLVKIGYTTQDVEERIKNAEKESTFLEAPVRILAVIECFNLNPQKFENLIHAFLYQQRLNMALMSTDGSTYHPEEWFTVDKDTAIKVCECIVDGTITQYRMDNVSGKMVRK